MIVCGNRTHVETRDMASLATSIIFEERIEVPLTIRSLADFRRWATSDEFPETGRIDFVDGRIEVSTAAEDFYCHGGLKTEIAGVLCAAGETRQIGASTDRLRPILQSRRGPFCGAGHHFSLTRLFDRAALRLIPRSDGAAGQYVEIEGSTDLVVEIVDDNSVTKGHPKVAQSLLPGRRAEFWLADARGETPIFIIHRPARAIRAGCRRRRRLPAVRRLRMSLPARRYTRRQGQLGVRSARGGVSDAIGDRSRLLQSL